MLKLIHADLFLKLLRFRTVLKVFIGCFWSEIKSI